MNIHILQAKRNLLSRTNKDTNGGYGTVNDFGNGWASRLLAKLKTRSMNFPELAPAYASAILKAQGHCVTYGENSDNPAADITLLQTSIVHYNEELRQARALRKKYPGMKIGLFAGVCDAYAQKYADEFDFVITGEFESALMKREIGNFSRIEKGEFIDDLNEIPYPNWDHVPETLGTNLVTRKSDSKLFPMLASRGCPMSCRYYCTYPLIQGTRQRKRSIENIIGEIKHLINKYGMNLVLFRDPIFSLDMEHSRLLCERIIAEKLKFDWICETHPKFLNDDMLSLFSAAGCRAVKLGIESGNKEVIGLSKRQTQEFDFQYQIIRSCEKNNIKVLGFFIIGYFDDAIATIEQTIDHAIWLNAYGAQFTVATPYPGTDWYNDIKKQNDIYSLSENPEDYTQYNLVYRHPQLTSNQIMELMNKAYRKYYFRLGYIWKHHLGSFFR